MSLKIYKDLVDDCSVAYIPESGNFKCVGDSFIQKKDPFLYDENKLIIKKGFGVDIFDGTTWRQVVNTADIELDPIVNLDTGDSLVYGKDYFIYVVLDENEPKILLSLNSTYPDGFDEDSSRKIGGFHVGHIRKVSDDGEWVPVDSAGIKFGSSGIKWEDNVTTGIVPNSVWDLKNRPKTLFGGMVQINKNLWVSIYLASAEESLTFMNGVNGLSVADGRLQSKYGVLPVTGSEGANFYNFNELAQRQGLRLLSYSEWCAAAYGSPQGVAANNNYAWAATSNTGRTFTGCQVNTSTGERDIVNGVKQFAISAKNVVDCVGNVQEATVDMCLEENAMVWQFRDVMGTNQGKGWLPNETGMSLFYVGGRWLDNVNAGPRTIYMASYCPWSISSYCGVRLACDAA